LDKYYRPTVHNCLTCNTAASSSLLLHGDPQLLIHGENYVLRLATGLITTKKKCSRKKKKQSSPSSPYYQQLCADEVEARWRKPAGRRGWLGQPVEGAQPDVIGLEVKRCARLPQRDICHTKSENEMTARVDFIL